LTILELSSNEIKEKLRNGELTVAVYGLGRIGLPLSIAWLRAGASVIGVDLNPVIIQKLNLGISPIVDEPEVPEAIKKYAAEKRFRATTSLVRESELSDVKIVMVSTTIESEKGFYPSSIEKVLKAIGKGLKKGDVVIIESSVPPAYTGNSARTLLERESGLKVEEDFGLAFSPERVMVGEILYDIEEKYPKIVGGIGPKSGEAVASLYECIAKKGVILVDTKTAEIAKIFEGIYRDVNIALANEFAKLCNALNIDFMEVRKAANSQPYCHLHIPGCGVGGSCIPYYPYFALEMVGKGVDLPLTMKAREINEKMPEYTVELTIQTLKKLGKEIEGTKVAVLGLAFRGDTNDTRNSPAYKIIEALKKSGAHVYAYDPYINEDEKLKGIGAYMAKNVEEAINNATILIIATEHTQFKQLDFNKITESLSKPAAIVDGRNIIDPAKVPRYITYVGIGRKMK